MSSSELVIGVGLAALLAVGSYVVLVGIGRSMVALGFAEMPNDNGLRDASTKAEGPIPLWAHPILVCTVLVGIGATIAMLPATYRWAYGVPEAMSEGKTPAPSPPKTPASMEVEEGDPKGAVVGRGTHSVPAVRAGALDLSSIDVTIARPPIAQQIERKLQEAERNIAELRGSAEDVTKAVEKHEEAVRRLEDAVRARSELSSQCKIVKDKLREAQSTTKTDETVVAIYRELVDACEESLTSLVAPAIANAKILAEQLKNELKLNKSMHRSEAQTLRLALLVVEQTVLRSMLAIAKSEPTKAK